MKFNKMKISSAWLMSFLGIEKIEIKDNQVDFSEDQRTKIEEKLGAEQALKLFDGLNAEIQASEQEAKEQADLQAVLNEINPSASEDTSEQEDKSSATVQATEVIKNQKKQIEEMAKQPIEDAPEAVINHTNQLLNNAMNILPQHSATHLFGQNVAYQALENRPWNQRMFKGSAKATDWNSTTIPLLEGDIEHFVRENPDFLLSIYNEFEGLPAEWSRRTGVKDRVTSATISFGEVTQARKKGWAVKGAFEITPESGQVYAKQIDLEFTADFLQGLENTWISNLYNMNGSHPYKMIFVGYFLTETIKQRLLEDRNAQINGIYVPTPDDTAGNAVNSQDGLLIKLHRAIHNRKVIRQIPLGKPTLENIVDYVTRLVKSIPEEMSKKQGLELVLSNAWKLAYQEALGASQIVVYEQGRGIFKSTVEHVKDFPNIKLQALADLTDTDIMYVTFSKNHEELSYIPEEANQFTIGHDKRDTYAFADYKMGIRYQYLGMKLAKGMTNKYAAQMVWPNDMPVFGTNVTFPAYDNATGVLKMYYNHAKIDAGFTTDITEIEGVAEGQVIRITGNTALATEVKVKDGDKLDLTADFNLKSGGTLTLLAKANGEFKELNRTSAPPAIVDDLLEFDDTAIDAEKSSDFKFVGSAAKTLATILNGIEGKTIKITTGSANLTVSTAVGIASNAVLKGGTTDYIKLVFASGKWYEVAKQVTA